MLPVYIIPPLFEILPTPVAIIPTYLNYSCTFSLFACA